MQRLLLIRHCESTGRAADAPLTARGRAQALVLAERLAYQPVDDVISSPHLRARDTISPFAARAHLTIHIDRRLAERRLSLEPIDHWRDVVRRSFDDLDYRIPGGESGREALVRGRAAIEDALAAGHRLPALVTHGQLMTLVLHSIDPGFGFADWETLEFPDVYLVEGQPGGSYRFTRAS